jgi:hypothetical protein
VANRRGQLGGATTLLAEQVARFISGRGRADFDTDANPLHHGLTVVSRETRDYERTGVAIVSPWQS